MARLLSHKKGSQAAQMRPAATINSEQHATIVRARHERITGNAHTVPALLGGAARRGLNMARSRRARCFLWVEG